MIRRISLAAGVGLVLLGCSGKEPAAPTAGELTVELTSPSQTDGAVLLLVSGGPVTGTTGTQAGYQVSSAPAGTNTTRVVVTGAVTAGALLKVTVPDISLASGYTVTLEAVADRNSFALNDPSAYGITIRK